MATHSPPRKPATRRASKPAHRRQKDGDASDRYQAALGRKLAAVCETLDRLSETGVPADRLRHAWLRDRKQQGQAFDPATRAAIFAIGDDVLRHRGAIDWHLSAAGLKGQPRNALRLAALEIIKGQRKATDMVRLFAGRKDELPALQSGEEAVLRRLEGRSLDDTTMPPAARYSLPIWIEPRLRARFGSAFDVEMAAALRPAPVDLRINLLKADQASALAALKTDGLHARPMPLAPHGLRLPHGAHAARGRALEDGLVEVQDEGSQLVALLVEVAGAKLVIDFCAGAGGKSLAMAAEMQNRGRLIATDVLKGRLDRARLRLRRAGAHNVECREIEAKWLKRHAGQADRVLVDAPCTGSGVWRRKPDARWSLGPNDVKELRERQSEILDRAARLVRTGGRLVYATCSLLREEDEDQIEAFLARHSNFRLIDAREIWSRAIGGSAPFDGPMLLLSPGRHGTDGFFAAVLERISD